MDMQNTISEFIYVVRKTGRAASLVWPRGGIHSDSCLRGRPWVAYGPFLGLLLLLDSPFLSAPVCFAFRFAAALCFGFFLLLFLSFALLFGWQPISCRKRSAAAKATTVLHNQP